MSRASLVESIVASANGVFPDLRDIAMALVKVAVVMSNDSQSINGFDIAGNGDVGRRAFRHVDLVLHSDDRVPHGAAPWWYFSNHDRVSIGKLRSSA